MSLDVELTRVTIGAAGQDPENRIDVAGSVSGLAMDDVVFVMDSSIGQAAHDQASAFKAKVGPCLPHLSRVSALYLPCISPV